MDLTDNHRLDASSVGRITRWRLRRKATAAAQPLPGAWWQWLAAGIILAAAVAGITGIISYEHGLDVAHATRNTGLVAALIPLVPDLVIAMSSLVLVVASAIGERRPAAAIAALLVGIGWTVAQNVAAGWRDGTGGAVLAGGIPVAFVLTVELLLWLVRKVRRTRPDGAGGDDGNDGGAPVAPQPLTTMAALALLVASASQRDLAFALGVDRNRVLAWERRLAAVDGGVDEAPAPEPSLNGHVSA